MIDCEKHIKIQEEYVARISSFTSGKNRLIVLEHHQELLTLLLELRAFRNREVVGAHGVKNHKALNSSITSVECTCGEITNYKVALNSLSDFECPKRKVNHAGKV